MQAGTGIETQWTHFYDIKNDNFSDAFYAVFQVYNGKIALAERNAVIVRDIFNEDEFYIRFENFEGISSHATTSIIDVAFVDKGQRVRIVYLDVNFDEIIVEFELIL